jgi:prephenate dehydrogenase
MKIVVLGLGHIGSWLATELSKDNEVSAFDVDAAKTGAGGTFARLGRLSEIGDHRPHLLINAVTLQHTVRAFKEATAHLDGNCIICDVASVKGRIIEYYQTAPFPFVSVHPMFGPTFAAMDRVREENAVIITESCAEGRRFFEAFFGRLGVRAFNYSFEEHDRMMAYSLTVPFVSSMIFAACVDAKTVPGTTFTRHMAIARALLSEDDHLLAEILFNPHSVAEINRITSRLEFLKHIIGARDEKEAEEFFRRLRENITEG